MGTNISRLGLDCFIRLSMPYTESFVFMAYEYNSHENTVWQAKFLVYGSCTRCASLYNKKTDRSFLPGVQSKRSLLFLSE